MIMKYCAEEGFRTNRNMKYLRNINASDENFKRITYRSKLLFWMFNKLYSRDNECSIQELGLELVVLSMLIENVLFN